jgi:hypothetical protein
MTMVQPQQFIVFALLAFAVTIQAQDAKPGPGRYFVAVDGQDGWSGTLPAVNAGKTDGPFATLERARDEIRKLKAAGALQGPMTVHVRGGVYEIASTFTLGAEDSGTADSPVIYRAYQNEKPVLVGARKVTGFQPYKGGILQCPLKGTPLEGVVFRQLFFRGERMTMARYPNVDPRDPHGGTWAHVAATEGKEVN